MNPERILFITGKLAAGALESVVHNLEREVGFEASIHVAKISVAALMTTDWLKDKLPSSAGIARVVLPGLCRGNVDELSAALGGVPVERGPDDLLDLAAYFERTKEEPAPDGYDIEILAEINHANRLAPAELLASAQSLRASGADLIDLGTTPGEPWNNVGPAVQLLIDHGLRVSIDSFDLAEVLAATKAGAELVLSVHGTNIDRAADWDAEVVLIPDDPHGPGWLDELLRHHEQLTRAGVRHRIDPILDPIGFGFARSLGRYLRLREALPDAAVMLGIGNVTELTEVDSAGINTLLIGFCQELGIGSVLTTEVINWARSSTREIDAARRLMHRTVARGRLPKHAGSDLVMLRDPRLRRRTEEMLRRLQAEIRDPNFRLFVEGNRVVAMNGSVLEADTDPFLLFERLGVEDPSHAFYLGWEMMKASLAIQLGKEYTQDRALRWGLLTREEISHRDRHRPRPDGDQS